MSVGSQALERSALESKDRESLLQIATAMGGKPGSRAKKADIIDMILELAGVTTATPTSEEGGPDAGSAEPAAAEADRDAAKASGSSESARANGRGRDEGDDQPTASEPEARDGQEDSPSSANDTDRDSGSKDSSDERSASGSAPTNNGGGGQSEGETGNRRRRRRGRDRNRDAGQAAGAPANADDQWQGEPVEVAGLLDLRDEGYGFLRLNGYLPSRDDVYVSVKQVRQFGLRKGDHIKGASRPAARNEKNPALLRIDEVNGADPDSNRERRRFDELTPVIPDARLRLERADDPGDLTARVIDLVAPVGKGQRGLIVAPAGTETTSVLKALGRALEANEADLDLLVVTVDERPEEVTDLRRSVAGEVVSSTFDRPADEHTMVAELALERAKRLVEDGKDVVILFAGLTRLARAYNVSAPAAGRLVGGIDAGALYPPKRFFGAARNLAEGGSLTILATVAGPSGSPIDDIVYEELSGAANLELVLDQHLAERRVDPPIDVILSATAHEDQLLDAGELDAVTALRRALVARRDEAGVDGAVDLLVDQLGSSPTNEALLAAVAKEA